MPPLTQFYRRGADAPVRTPNEATAMPSAVRLSPIPAALLSARVPPSIKLLWSYLAGLDAPSSQRRIARALGMNLDTVKAATLRLVESGWLTIVSRSGPGAVNRYFTTTPLGPIETEQDVTRRWNREYWASESGRAWHAYCVGLRRR